MRPQGKSTALIPRPLVAISSLEMRPKTLIGSKQSALERFAGLT
jgi:hypothetical protein